MVKAILGKKIGMTRVFDEQGNSVSVTVLEAGPCPVTAIRTKEKNGYEAIQIGFGDISEKNVKNPQKVNFAKKKISPKRLLKEFRTKDFMSADGEEKTEIKIGDEIKVDSFKKGDLINVTATSKGKGFQGGVKRWNWSIGPKSHGSRSYRAPGSIGASADPSRVVKGKHLPGHMGAEKVTVKNLEIFSLDPEKNLMIIKGGVPGSNGSYLMVKKSGEVLRNEK